MHFHTLDFLVLILFGLGLIAIIIWVSLKKEESSSDYFLAGRNATWIAIGASIFASNIGSEHIVGLAGSGASTGMAMAHWEFTGWIILILAWVFVPFYSHSRIFTTPEFLEKRYNTAARSFLSIISLISYVFTKVAVTVYAGGVVIKEVTGIQSMFGIDFFWIGAIGLVVITAIYTVIGGMRSVLYTSVLQTPILLVGSIAILIIGLNKLGGWNEMMSICRLNVSEHGDPMTSLMRSSKDPDFPWLGTILGSMIIGFWYWCTDQYIVQRVLSGKNITQSRRGAIFGSYLKLTPVFIFLIPGMIAYALDQKGLLFLASSDAAFPALVSQLLPMGLKGLVVAGLLAALMSSLASLFNSSAMLFTVDFYQKFKPHAKQKELILVGRIATTIIVILGVLWIPILQGIGNVLYVYLQQVQSLFAPGIATVFFLGIFSKRITAQGGLWGMVSGFSVGMIRMLFLIFQKHMNPDSILYTVFVELNWLYFMLYLVAFSVFVTILVSLLTKKPDQEKIKGLTYSTISEEQKKTTKASWNKWDVIHSVVIVLILIAIYIYFW
ncbi:MAG: sodium/solute symporter [Bacteroidetes bacterium]|jgi:SSS family solute:Na+ symporter|nr:sodium/solute symporter [Bacteroidota bacterium]